MNVVTEPGRDVKYFLPTCLSFFSGELPSEGLTSRSPQKRAGNQARTKNGLRFVPILQASLHMRRNRLAIFSGRLINVLFYFLDCRAVELLWSREDFDRLHVAGGVDESVYLDTACNVVPQGFRRRNRPHRVNELGRNVVLSGRCTAASGNGRRIARWNGADFRNACEAVAP